MNRKNHKTEYEPWDDGFYSTGSTNPPKSHGGLIAGLLIGVIVLSSLSTAMGILNIRQDNLTAQPPEKEDDSISFQDTSRPIQNGLNSVIQTPGTTLPANSGDMSLELETSPAGVDNIPQEGGLSLQEIYKRNIDSVVSITCRLGDSTSSGTGVIVSELGYIVTNAHVIKNAQAIRVELTNGQSFTAAVVGADEVSDLAVLYIRALNLQAAQFGNSDVLQVGDTVVAIGDPLGCELRGTYTDGIVSAINRDVTISGRVMTLIQTNAALNAGNSGGPLINCYGQVVGINTMKVSDQFSNIGVEGLGFAIPSTTVQQIVNQLVKQGYVSGRPTLGITGEALSGAYQHFYQLPSGLQITVVDQSSDAALKGIRPGDILLTIDGVAVTSPEALNEIILSHQAGDELEAVIYRNRRRYTVILTVGEFKK